MKKHEKISIRAINVKRQISEINDWKIAEIDKKDVHQFVRDLEIGKVTGNQMSEGTLSDYISKIKKSLEFLNKPTSKLTEKDTERLVEALLRDELCFTYKKKDEKGKTIKHKTSYSENSKCKIKNVLIKYLEWKLGDKASKLTPILKVRPRIKETTPDFFKEEDAEKLYKACKTAEERFLIAVLFDSGARAEEFLNIRREDIELPKDVNNYVRLTLKEEYSKTKGRTISLYWRYTAEAVIDYVKERTAEGVKPEEPIFRKDYKTSKKFLYRLGLRVLNRTIHYHLFRHSSATYYASKLNRQQLCYRYGWRFRSPMPDRYINREGMEQKELDEKFEQTEISDLKTVIEREKQKSRVKEEELEEIKRTQDKLMEDLKKRQELDLVLNKILKNPEIMKALGK